MHQQQRSAVPGQGLLDHLARIHRCLAHRAAKHLDVFDDTVLCIQMDDGEHLVLQRPQLHPQEVAHHLRRVQDFAVAHLSCEYTLRSLQHLVGVGRTVVARDIANEKGRIERMSKLRHDRAPVRIGRNCLEPEEHAAAQAVRGRRRPHGRQRAGHAQPLTARTAWYIEGNSKTTPHTPPP